MERNLIFDRLIRLVSKAWLTVELQGRPLASIGVRGGSGQIAVPFAVPSGEPTAARWPADRRSMNERGGRTDQPGGGGPETASANFSDRGCPVSESTSASRERMATAAPTASDDSAVGLKLPVIINLSWNEIDNHILF